MKTTHFVMIIAAALTAVLSADPNYPFNYVITATGSEEAVVYPDQSFNWSVTGTGTETWHTYPNQPFVWTVTATATETWYNRMPGETDPSAYGFYNSGGTWYKDGNRVTSGSVSEFRVINGKPFWRSGSTYYYCSMMTLHVSTGEWGDRGPCTVPNATCFFVFNGDVYYKAGNTYYYNSLNRYTLASGEWGDHGPCSASGATNFIITSEGVFYSFSNGYHYNNLSIYHLATGSWDNDGVCTHNGASQFRVSGGDAYWSNNNSYYRNSLGIFTISSSTWGSISSTGFLPAADVFYVPCDYGQQSAVRTASDSGTGMVHAQEGNKFIDTFSAVPPPQQGGTMGSSSYSLSCSNPSVSATLSGSNVYASTSATETHSAVRTASDTGAGIVNASESNKLIEQFSAYPAAVQGGTISNVVYLISDDSGSVVTWTMDNAVYASTNVSELVTTPWSQTEAGSSSIGRADGEKSVCTCALAAPNGDTIWTADDDSAAVHTRMTGNQLMALLNGPVVYVDANATGNHDGSTWSDAFNYLQDALAYARQYPEVAREIRAAQGTYRPDRLSAYPDGTGDRMLSFELAPETALFGGFPGGDCVWDDRNPHIYPTILSGDLAGNDSVLFDIENLTDDPARTENSYHVVSFAGSGSSTLLSGITITGGNANSEEVGSPQANGGGIYNQGDLVIQECVLAANSACANGGAIYTSGDCSLSHCILTENAAYSGAGVFGDIVSALKLFNCTLSQNRADQCGGAVFARQSWPTIMNSILWNDAPDELASDQSTFNISFCCIDDAGCSGIGIICTDPLFAAANENDFHLKSTIARWDPGLNQWTSDDVTSPCIDAGNPGTPLANEPMSMPGQNLRINMGTFGGTPQASTAPYGWALLCDITNDGIVDVSDLSIFTSYWLNTGQQPGDFNRDGIVNLQDLSLLSRDWSKEATWH